MYYNKWKDLFYLSFLFTLLLFHRSEAFTAGAGGWQHGKKSGIFKKQNNAPYLLAKICSAARAFCPTEMSSTHKARDRSVNLAEEF
ncbi:hypothetical protein P5673_031727 [Acropora cervicornis]|uniref:Secreted protein n=1 Tax=Acropora cervicornis TaxID=6130 RepID=A0AAD9USK9_ACRCE|nr:hypothetical protein P5673_031727 [Acropora cervicornis]